MAERHKRVTYIVKDDAMDAINDVHTGRKEDYQWAVRSVPGVKLKRSRYLAKVAIRPDGEEVCPHCHKKLQFYNILNPPPKFCYCLWCGSAIERERGNRNGYFDYSILEGREQGGDDYEERPSPRQYAFCKAISRMLDIPMPESRTKDAYNKFIKAHQTDYYQRVRKNG